VGLFDDFSRFLESRLEEFLRNNPHLELALLEQLREQERKIPTADCRPPNARKDRKTRFFPPLKKSAGIFGLKRQRRLGELI